MYIYIYISLFLVIYLLKHEYINTKRNKLTNLNSKTKRINHELKLTTFGYEKSGMESIEIIN